MPDLQDWNTINWPRTEIKPGRGVTRNPCKVTWLLDIGDQADSNQRVGIIKRWYQAKYRFLEEAQVPIQSIANLCIQLQKMLTISGRVKCMSFRDHYQAHIGKQRDSTTQWENWTRRHTLFWEYVRKTNSRRGNLEHVDGDWSKIKYLGLELSLWQWVTMSYWTDSWFTSETLTYFAFLYIRKKYYSKFVRHKNRKRNIHYPFVFYFDEKILDIQLYNFLLNFTTQVVSTLLLLLFSH